MIMDNRIEIEVNKELRFKCVKDNDVLFSEEYVIYVKKGNTELLEKIFHFVF